MFTSVEKRAVFEATIEAGARRAFLLEEPMAAAIGGWIARLKNQRDLWLLISVVVRLKLRLFRWVYCYLSLLPHVSLRIAGNELDESIAPSCSRRIWPFNRYSHGRRYQDKDRLCGGLLPPVSSIITFPGRDLSTNLPRNEVIASEDVREGIRAPLQDILIAIKEAFLETDPDLAADIIRNGVLSSRVVEDV